MLNYGDLDVNYVHVMLYHTVESNHSGLVLFLDELD